MVSRLMLRLWRDDGGALLALEWAFLATLLVIGITTGLVAVRSAVNTELTQVANAAMSLDQGFSFPDEELVCPNGLVLASSGGGQAISVPNRLFRGSTAPVPQTITVPPCTEESGGIGPATGPATTGYIRPTLTPGTTREACTDLVDTRDNRVRRSRFPGEALPD
jgi:Flp pilus assembly pilin Flp